MPGRFAFGTLGLADLPIETVEDLVSAALEAGITVFDTAHAYGRGESERRLGLALGGRPRASYSLISKVGLAWVDGTAVGRLGRAEVRHQLDQSLRRLGTDHLDVVLAHMPDPSGPIGEAVSSMAGLVTDGGSRAFGWSNFPLEDVVAAHYEARLHGLPPPTVLQCQYNILERSAEDGLLPSARRLGYTTSVWGALAGGWLTERAVRDGAPSTAPSRVRSRPGSFDASLESNAARLDVVRRLHAVARAIGQPLERMAIAFALSHPDVSRVVIGPGSRSELDGYLAAGELSLPVDVLEEIDRIVPPGTTVNPADLAWRRPDLDRIRSTTAPPR